MWKIAITSGCSRVFMLTYLTAARYVDVARLCESWSP